MILIKTKEQIQKIKEGGKILSSILDVLESEVKPGISTGELDDIARALIKKYNGTSAFEGYQPDKSVIPFPSVICASVNDEIVHTPASHQRVLHEGDIIGIDIGLKYNGYFTDMARTIGVGNVSEEVSQLLDVTKKALFKGIEQVKPGNSIRSIGKAIEEYAKPFGYGIVRDLVGHGVGIDIHEEPTIPNYDVPHLDKIILKEGMVIAIEPMLNMGTHKIAFLEDGWTIVTRDGSLSAQFEHTVIVTRSGYEIATQ